MLLTKSEPETVSLSMRYTRSRIANGRRFRSFQNLIDEQTDLEAQENRIKNQIYLLIIDTMWIYYLIIYFVVWIAFSIINLSELIILIKKTKGKKEL